LALKFPSDVQAQIPWPSCLVYSPPVWFRKASFFKPPPRTPSGVRLAPQKTPYPASQRSPSPGFSFRLFPFTPPVPLPQRPQTEALHLTVKDVSPLEKVFLASPARLSVASQSSPSPNNLLFFPTPVTSAFLLNPLFFSIPRFESPPRVFNSRLVCFFHLNSPDGFLTYRSAAPFPSPPRKPLFFLWCPSQLDSYRLVPESLRRFLFPTGAPPLRFFPLPTS